MRGTRSSARQATRDRSSPQPVEDSAGTKRKADDSSPANKTKRGRQSSESKKKTPEDANPQNVEANSCTEERSKPTKQESNGKEVNGESKAQEDSDRLIHEPGKSFQGKTKDGEPKDDPEKALKDSRGTGGVNNPENPKKGEHEFGKTTEKHSIERQRQPSQNQDAKAAVEEDEKRGRVQSETILEKGIIYFFTRGRVDVDDPEGPQDLQRSYFVMRPLPAGGKITTGVIQDVGNNRLVALPKKVWPKSGNDRFLAFVEKAGVSMQTLRDEFFQGSEYSTKTAGTRHTPKVSLLGEGVYIISHSSNGHHTNRLSYMLTIPQKLGKVQEDVGLAKQGSFIISVKNPNSSGPANAQLSEGAQYPKDIMEEFGSRGWLPAQPKHFDYPYAQVLLIGESRGLDGVLAAGKEGKGAKEEGSVEELEKLEQEDDLRIEHTNGDDTIFADLGVSTQEYPLVTTWD